MPEPRRTANRRNQGRPSVRNAALARLSTPNTSAVVGRIVLLSLFMLALIGFALVMLTSGGGQGNGGDFKPVAVGQYNFMPVKEAESEEPGYLVFSIPESEGGGTISHQPPPLPAPVLVSAGEDEPESALPFSRRLTDAIAAEGGLLSARLQAQAAIIDSLKHPPAFTLPVRIDQDLWSSRTPSGSINEHLAREFRMAERQPVPGGDPKSGPFYQPFMMETPRIALEALLRQVAAASSQQIADSDNGRVFVNFDEPRAIEAVRGTVFTVEGRLWMLRQQPLRHPVTMDGEEVRTAYWGIVAFLRPGLNGIERDIVHDLACFTALRLPPELARHALPAGQHASSEDSLAKEVVGIQLQGAWFRRIGWREPVAELQVELPQDPDPRVRPADTTRQFVSEAFMPYLVSRTASVTAFELPDVQETRRIVTLYSEDDTPIGTREKDHFDEAGYYTLLAHTAAGSSPMQELPVAELTLRELLTPTAALRNHYRGARTHIKGILMDSYHPLVLPPNISGVRHLYRTFVADAATQAEVTQELIWYVDVLEPPLKFRGSPAVEVEGFYCRSQLFRASVQGRGVLLNLPLVVSRSIAGARVSLTAAAPQEGVTPSTIMSIIGACVLVMVTVLLLWRREKKREERWQREMLAGLTRGKAGAGGKAQPNDTDADQ